MDLTDLAAQTEIAVQSAVAFAFATELQRHGMQQAKQP